MLEGRPRVLVDTSVWISAFINPNGAPAVVLAALRDGRFVPVISQALLDEIEEVASRPRIRRLRRLGDEDVVETLTLLRDRGIAVVPSGDLRLCRDPEDDFVLETAVLGEAQCLVSRDDDIKRDLDLIEHLRARGVEVLSVAQFLDLLRGDVPRGGHC